MQWHGYAQGWTLLTGLVLLGGGAAMGVFVGLSGVGVWSSSGIGVNGRSLKDEAVDGRLPNVMIDWELLLSASQRSGSIRSIGRGSVGMSPACGAVQRIGGTGPATGCDGGEPGDFESGMVRDRFCRPSPSRERSSLSAMRSSFRFATHFPLIAPDFGTTDGLAWPYLKTFR